MEPEPEPTSEHYEEERVLSSDALSMEDDFLKLGQKRLEMGQIFAQIQDRASSELKWEEIEEHYACMDDLLKQRAMEVELTEKCVMEKSVELEKKEERLKEVELLQESMPVRLEMKEKEIDMRDCLEKSAMRLTFEKKEERLKEVELLQESMPVRLEMKEKEIDMRDCLEKSAMRLTFEKAKEELRKELEEMGREVERLAKLNDDKSCELERKVKEFDTKEKVLIEMRDKEAELVKESLKQLDAKQKEISFLDEAVKELIKAAEEDEIFEAEQNAKGEEMGSKRKALELRMNELDRRESDLELKQMMLQERSIRAESLKRSREQLFCSAKKHKHCDADKDEDSASVFSVSTSSSEETSEEHQDESDEDCVEQIACPDSEFHDFKKPMSSFEVGAVWALYDPLDDMPRFYAKIERIIKPDSSLEVTWLEPPEEESAPVACGRFIYGNTKTMSYLAFSHEMQPTIIENFITLNPSIGETWALFTDRSSNKPPYEYDLVEIIRSYDDQVGVGVSYLGKVEGFVSVFQHAAQHGFHSFMIEPEEMRRFSHRVPSFRMKGDEKKGVPAHSFELDPAAVPSSLLKLDHSIHEEAKETTRQNKDQDDGVAVKDQDEPRNDTNVTVILD